MKYRTTAKALSQSGEPCLSIGYCGAQYLLTGLSPVAYAAGKYGWNFDVYNTNGVNICTGYRGMPGKSVDYEILRQYEKQAESVYSSNLPYDERIEKIRSIRDRFLSAVL